MWKEVGGKKNEETYLHRVYMLSSFYCNLLSMEDTQMGRRGGTAQSIRGLTVWCLIITIAGFFLLSKYIRIRNNYTLLHHRVNQLEMEIEKCQK